MPKEPERREIVRHQAECNDIQQQHTQHGFRNMYLKATSLTMKSMVVEAIA
jgi:hypothetical protein